MNTAYPPVDVIFLNRTFAQAQSLAYANAPRDFLLALTRMAPPHALLVIYLGADGAAVLSVPTREYFQSSGWTRPPTLTTSTSTSASAPSSSLSTIATSTNATPFTPRRRHSGGAEEAESVRTGSGFWAAGHDSSHGSSAFSASLLHHIASHSSPASPHAEDSGDDSDRTEIASNAGLNAARRATRGQQPTQQQQQQLPCAPYAPDLASSAAIRSPTVRGWTMEA